MHISFNSRRFVYGIVMFLTLSYSCSEKEVNDRLFNRLTSEETGIDFNNQLNIYDSEINIITYLYAFNGGGVAVEDFNNDGLPDIYFAANQGYNKLYQNSGSMKFEDVTEKAGVAGLTSDWSTGVSFADVNQDGWLDIYVCNVGNHLTLRSKNNLYINNQDGTFSERAKEYGLDYSGYSTQAGFFDYDLDGDLDMYLLNHNVHNSGNYVAASKRQIADSLYGDRLYENVNGKFKNITAKANIFSSSIGFGLGLSISDFNNDGYPDIYVGNDFHENDYLYINQKDGTFEETSEDYLVCHSQFSMGNAAADLNEDGMVDLMVLDMKPFDTKVLKSTAGVDNPEIYNFKLDYGYQRQYPKNTLHLNHGQGFQELSAFMGLEGTDWSWSNIIEDFDLDGRKDVFVGNGIIKRPNDLDYMNYISNSYNQKNDSDSVFILQMPSGLVQNQIFKGTEAMFENKSQEWLPPYIGSTTGVAKADFDLDGDIDLVLNNINDKAVILENTSIDSNSDKSLLHLRFDKSITFADAYIEFKNGMKRYKQIQPVTGFQSQSERTIHFIFSDSLEVNNVCVHHLGKTWCNDNFEKENNLYFDTLSWLPVTRNKVRTKPISYTIVDSLKENKYNESAAEPLLPFYYAEQGPALHAVNLDSDPELELFVGSSIGFKPFLIDDSNQRVDVPNFTTSLEEVDVEFVDVDGDNDLDIITISGPSQIGLMERNFEIVYYRNDGNLQFSNPIPLLEGRHPINASCIEVWDYDNDGDLDLFVGAKNIMQQYGKIQKSFLVENRGDSKFTLVSDFPAEIGIVMDAKVGPDNHLWTVGHWMPITSLKYENNRWVVDKIPNSSGLWNAIEWDKEAAYIGNLGLNTELYASNEHPIYLVSEDFDSNGSIDPVVIYKPRSSGSYISLTSKSSLDSHIPALKKRDVSYKKFAEGNIVDYLGVTLNDIDLKIETLKSFKLSRNSPSSSWELSPLDMELQTSPINAFEIYDQDLIVAGNNYNMSPYIGVQGNLGLIFENNSGIQQIINNTEIKCIDHNASNFWILLMEERTYKITHLLFSDLRGEL